MPISYNHRQYLQPRRLEDPGEHRRARHVLDDDGVGLDARDQAHRVGSRRAQQERAPPRAGVVRPITSLHT